MSQYCQMIRCNDLTSCGGQMGAESYPVTMADISIILPRNVKWRKV